ncbi:MAG TPA: SDR family NAD(P)-dependent oxidoreductase [Microthrixaceae bacterium]|nr:SDR family NAD(P)-dependent oxidoreductase [Microthrixaceae bacterium]RTL08026.1 MAG: SDR family NAD(P)-dependent oxidoreductase [Acidimicrobiia bacterium]MCB9375607.1 SDR family NAD(P)-dependent oxidoreductase [Microthrixaceae bacterium]MCB9402207.1 SDR family NAD(P)-dependent oxidoreductase [Microthrixaceae bacterium]MCO5304369.1 SDR family NAD(P)-dependent oxidoreductase [Microthrixaceae bacterium]
MPSPSLDGVAIVTGAGGGIGAAVARSLAAAGTSLVLADRDRSALEAVAASLPPSVTVITGVGDVGDPTHHAALVTAAEDLGGVTVSVQNAGVALTGLSWEVPLEQWELQVRTNYWGVVHGVRAALPPMVRRGLGHVLAVASGAGLVATPGLAPYVSSKHAVVGLMESVRHELARAAPGVRASVVCPGNIATPINANSLAVADAAGAADVAACEGSAGDGSTAAVARQIDETVRRGVDSGAEPQTVADAIVEAVSTGRFWVLPQPEVALGALDRVQRIVDGRPPADLLI